MRNAVEGLDALLDVRRRCALVLVARAARPPWSRRTPRRSRSRSTRGSSKHGFQVASGMALPHTRKPPFLRRRCAVLKKRSSSSVTTPAISVTCVSLTATKSATPSLMRAACVASAARGDEAPAAAHGRTCAGTSGWPPAACRPPRTCSSGARSSRRGARRRRCRSPSRRRGPCRRARRCTSSRRRSGRGRCRRSCRSAADRVAADRALAPRLGPRVAPGVERELVASSRSRCARRPSTAVERVEQRVDRAPCRSRLPRRRRR